MKLSRIEITNFRCFESLTVSLQPDVNVLVGVNAAGKTTILDAIAIALYDVVAANGGGGKRQRQAQQTALRPSDIHIAPGASDQMSGRKDHVLFRAWATDFYPVTGFMTAERLEGHPALVWQDFIRYAPPNDFNYSSGGSDDLNSYFKSLWDAARREEKALIAFPVVAYYRATRRISEMPPLGDIFKLRLERQLAFKDAMDAGSSYQSMCQWFYLRENQELREKLKTQEIQNFQYPDLKAIRQAISKTLENVKRIFFNENPPSLMVEFENGCGAPRSMALTQLSDGYRNLLGIVLDFSRRLALAHPNWDNPLEAPGILLIDEIDLHLHPKWQQRIIPNLQDVFPNTQIIVTTHSPQVLTTVHRRNITIIKDQQLHMPNGSTYGAESQQIMRQVMGADGRPPDNPNAEAIYELFALINRGELEAAGAKCQELMSQIGPDDPTLIEAETTIKNRLWEKELGL
ncbi:AAA family ATPase [Azospirillum picis]|uniref:ATP-binding protein involved in virulence n=1 Tax=Azospirillum picis TaxID=488438 RepID=A0ABU0MVL5_9PROT|nr:AAA family ATPase [Azospirillum picis]MBP2303485.1 putative ATP-binding protein involved in virulence [Azospirillum picis]MDQ0537364.1 putative ATP-binding protein involved in virulence [Azospirillum picis]